MLRISKRTSDKSQCSGFLCLVKKGRQSVGSCSSASRVEPGAIYLDSLYDIEMRNSSSSTVSSSLTSLSGLRARRYSGEKVTFPDCKSDCEYSESSSCTVSSSLSVLSGVYTTNQLSGDMKLTKVQPQMDFEFSKDYSCRDSSSLTPSSGVYTSWFNGDLQETKPQLHRANPNPRNCQRPQVGGMKLSNTLNRQNFPKLSDKLDVVSSGTRLMRRIQYPTVIVQMTRRLHHSMVFYVIVEPVSGRYKGDIACLLFVGPYSTKDVQRAELLPFKTVRSRVHSETFKVAPMLLSERYSCLFKEGCSFKLKSIEQGRPLDWKKKLWKNYDLGKREVNRLLRRLIDLDIALMPSHMFKSMAPLRVFKQRTKIRRRERRKSYRSLLHQRSRVIESKNLIKFSPDLYYSVLNIGDDSSFTCSHKFGLSQRHLTKDFVFIRKTEVTKDAGINMRGLNVYSNISDII